MMLRGLISAWRLQTWGMFKKSFYCFLCCSALLPVYLVRNSVSPLSAGIFCCLLLAIVIPVIEDELKRADHRFEEEQAVELLKKEKLQEASLYKLNELVQCVMCRHRYQLESSWTKGGSGTIYKFPFPDFIHDILEIPTEKRVISLRVYYSINPEYNSYNQYSVDHTLCDNKYRPLEKEIELVIPKLKHTIESELSHYVEPLQEQFEISDQRIVSDKYIHHIMELIESLKQGMFDEMNIRRKVYNSIYK